MARLAQRNPIRHIEAQGRMVSPALNVVRVQPAIGAMAAVLAGMFVAAANSLHPRQILTRGALLLRHATFPIPMALAGQFGLRKPSLSLANVGAVLVGVLLAAQRRARHACLQLRKLREVAIWQRSSPCAASLQMMATDKAPMFAALHAAAITRVGDDRRDLSASTLAEHRTILTLRKKKSEAA